MEPGRTTSDGCGTKVIRTLGTPRSGASSTALPMIAACPRWTPSKTPMVTTQRPQPVGRRPVHAIAARPHCIGGGRGRRGPRPWSRRGRQRPRGRRGRGRGGRRPTARAAGRAARRRARPGRAARCCPRPGPAGAGRGPPGRGVALAVVRGIGVQGAVEEPGDRGQRPAHGRGLQVALERGLRDLGEGGVGSRRR